MDDAYKLPRIYVDAPFQEHGNIPLPSPSHHYLRNVMRLEPGAEIRVFNGRDGEFLGSLSTLNKKNAIVTLVRRLREQPQGTRKIHLLFAPIKKERMDWLLEKAVELGVSEIYPVLTQNTDQRKINEDRMEAQIIDAAEQCERLDIPVLHPVQDLLKVLATWETGLPLLAAIERFDAKKLSDSKPAGDCAILIGPSGGFTAEEKDRIAGLPFITPVSLGETVLRSETAVAAALSVLSL